MAEEGPPPSTQTLDPIAQRKHAAMLERISNHHQSRLHASAARRSASAASPSFDSVAAFLDRFSELRRSIESDLARCRGAAPAAAADICSAPAIKPELEKVSASISDLERLLAENSYFLPSYEVRSSLKAISDLKEALEVANSELLPRKKFSFRNKAPKKESATLVKEIDERKVPDEEKSNLAVVRDTPGFRNEKGAVLVKKFRASEEDEGDFTLANLESCKVYLKGRFRALFVHRLKDCNVFAGPVLGSILIEEASNCVFMLASHQIRIHQATVADFYLRVRSRPIIEDCSGVRFAPYRLFYEGIDEELRVSGLGVETENWANVDDFKWLRAVQSPNWCLIPEDERLGSVNISEVTEQDNDN
ncbi:tubulin-folding cofactor C [Ananas comosus]|uniref:Tubulin-folding cofactor C n=2 Tax=Ananas comosus TaxID=4615 RepID=A0A6P5G900_ANACO|nr:tubulin-folding cofactor C [Ananas comosus]